MQANSVRKHLFPRPTFPRSVLQSFVEKVDRRSSAIHPYTNLRPLGSADLLEQSVASASPLYQPSPDCEAISVGKGDRRRGDGG